MTTITLPAYLVVHLVAVLNADVDRINDNLPGVDIEFVGDWLEERARSEEILQLIRGK